jgi:hypothetical protein
MGRPTAGTDLFVSRTLEHRAARRILPLDELCIHGTVFAMSSQRLLNSNFEIVLQSKAENLTHGKGLLRFELFTTTIWLQTISEFARFATKGTTPISGAAARCSQEEHGGRDQQQETNTCVWLLLQMFSDYVHFTKLGMT